MARTSLMDRATAEQSLRDFLIRAQVDLAATADLDEPVTGYWPMVANF